MSAGEKYASAQPAAEARYIAIARELGWVEGTPLTHGQGEESSDEEGEPTAEELLARDSDDEVEGNDAGMGSVVSKMEASEVHSEDISLHTLAISGEGEMLENFLAAHPSVDVDGRDEYVRTSCMLRMQVLTTHSGIYPITACSRQR